MCIDESSCTGTVGHANNFGDCINCLATTGSDGMPQVINTEENGCIDAITCTDTGGWFVDTSTSSCTDCTMTEGSDRMPQVVGLDGVSCIDATTCTNTVRQAIVDKECMTCGGSKPITNVDKTACISSSECTADNAHSVDIATMACFDDMDVDGIADSLDSCANGVRGLASTIDDTAATADPDEDGCKNSEDLDDDDDGIPDTMDAFDYDVCASVDTDGDGKPDSLLMSCTTSLTADDDDDADGIDDADDNCPAGILNVASGGDSAPTADPDDDGCKNREDVDDDNNGLIEIATAADLNNMRFDLDGHSYDDELDDGAGNEGSTAGAPKSATATLCTAETTSGSSIYLCGYELVASIDFFGPDGTSGGGDDIDLNGGAAGNIDPITGREERHLSTFEAIFEGNDYTISNLNIDRVTGTTAGSDTVLAALFISCARTMISNLTLVNPMIRGRVTVGGICDETSANVVLRNVHVQGGSVQGGSDPRVGYMGGLVGRASGGHIESCSSSANVSGGWDQVNNMGGLVGEAIDILIVSSRSSGNVSDGGDGADNMGGLVGNSLSAQIVSSRSSGNVSDGGDGADNMGGLIGDYSMFGVSSVRDSMSSGRVCDGVLTTSCAAGSGADNIGALIGYLGGYISSAFTTNVHNCLAVGQTESNAGDNIGFLGNIFVNTGDMASTLNGVLTNNHFDNSATGTGITAKVGALPAGSVVNADLTGITGSATNILQVATAYTGWSTTRWLFVAMAYPQPVYFDFDRNSDADDNPLTMAEDVIDICEDITPTNDATMDEGSASRPDCGDVLTAWPRP